MIQGSRSYGVKLVAQVMEFYIDAHRKAIVNKVSNSIVIAILDSIPQVLNRDLYEETISFRDVDIVKRRLNQKISCGDDKYMYTVFEEALCLKNQEDCTTISYIINIECIDTSACEDKDIVNLIKCIASSIKT